MRPILAALLTFLLAHSAQAGGPALLVPGCGADLRPGVTYRLGIGVLARGEDGGLDLGISSYAGSIHTVIVEKLIEQTPIHEILWMGEIRYHSAEGVITIVEANETSGYFNQIQREGLEIKGKSISVRNSFANLPMEILTPDFKGHVFDPRDMRLARELRKVKGDVRHSIGNSLQLVSSVAVIVSMDRTSHEQKKNILDTFLGDNADDLTLVRWLVRTFFDEEKINAEEFGLMNGLLHAFEARDLARIAATDQLELDHVMQKLSRLINPRADSVPVDLYRIR